MVKANEIAEKHVSRLWNNSSCPAYSILADAINEALEWAAQQCEEYCQRHPDRKLACVELQWIIRGGKSQP